MQTFGLELFLLVPPDVKQHRLTLTDPQFTSLISAWKEQKETMDRTHLATFQTAIDFTFTPLIQRQIEPIGDNGTFTCPAFVGESAMLDHKRNEHRDISEQFGTAGDLPEIPEQSVAEDNPPDISEQFGTAGDLAEIPEQSVAEDDHRHVLEQSVAEDDSPKIPEQSVTEERSSGEDIDEDTDEESLFKLYTNFGDPSE